MTPEEFVAALEKTVLTAAVDATVATLEQPPGRRPRQDLVEASAWFRSLAAPDQAMLIRVLNMTAHHAVFGLLAVIDGSRAIEDDSEKGEFRLIFRKGSEQWDLTEGNSLHEILTQRHGSKSSSR